jgi:hypothetical protein
MGAKHSTTAPSAHWPTVSWKDLVASWREPSLTLTWKTEAEETASVGVPLNTPVATSIRNHERDGGSSARLKPIGGVPPLTESENE